MLGNLFKKGTSKSTREVDLPDWVKDQYQAEYGRGTDIFNQATGIADQLGADPREVLGPSQLEQAGLDRILGGVEDAQGILTDQNAMRGDIAAQGVDRVSGLSQDLAEFDPTQGGRVGDRSLDQALDFYQNDYTDDVVNTTLSGMDLQRERERAANELRSAKTGGTTTNTRRAVQEAINDQLFGMNRAEKEAGLRSSAFDTAASLAQGETKMGMDEDQSLDNLTRGLMGDAADLEEMRFGADKFALDPEYAKQMADLSSVAGQSQLAFGGMERGLEQAGLDAERTAEKDALDWLKSIYGGTTGDKPGGLSTTTTKTPTASPFEKIAGMGLQAAGMATGMGWKPF